MLVAFCEQYNVPYRTLGKILVATTEAQKPGLDSIRQTARASGRELAPLSQAELREMEPDLSGVAGLFSPWTGIIDSHRYGLCEGLSRVAGNLCWQLHQPMQRERERQHLLIFQSACLIPLSQLHDGAGATDRGTWRHGHSQQVCGIVLFLIALGMEHLVFVGPECESVCAAGSANLVSHGMQSSFVRERGWQREVARGGRCRRRGEGNFAVPSGGECRGSLGARPLQGTGRD